MSCSRSRLQDGQITFNSMHPTVGHIANLFHQVECHEYKPEEHTQCNKGSGLKYTQVDVVISDDGTYFND